MPDYADILANPSAEVIADAMPHIKLEMARQSVVLRRQGQVLQRGARTIGDVFRTNLIEPIGPEADD